MSFGRSSSGVAGVAGTGGAISTDSLGCGIASAEQIRCLCHCIENFMYSKETKDKLRPFKQDLADLADRSRSFRTKKEILVQRGSGFLGLVLGPLLEGLAELV